MSEQKNSNWIFARNLLIDDVGAFSETLASFGMEKKQDVILTDQLSAA